ncbi:MAG: hypothetical protein QXT36_03785 [Candidatus Micrarchaeaceae archaeon]
MVSFVYYLMSAHAISAFFVEPLFSPISQQQRNISVFYSGHLYIFNFTNTSVLVAYQAENGSELINLTLPSSKSSSLTLLGFYANGTYHSCFPTFEECILKEPNSTTATYFKAIGGLFEVINATQPVTVFFNGQNCSLSYGTFIASPNSTAPVHGSFSYCFSQRYRLPLFISINTTVGNDPTMLSFILTKVSNNVSESNFTLPYPVVQG